MTASRPDSVRFQWHGRFGRRRAAVLGHSAAPFRAPDVMVRTRLEHTRPGMVTPFRRAASERFGMDEAFRAWLDSQQGRQYELHERHLNPAFVKMLRTIGLDKGYVRG